MGYPRESDHELRRASLSVCVASAADLEAEACKSAILKLARRAFRRTLAINLSLVLGCGAGIPCESSHSLRSRNILAFAT